MRVFAFLWVLAVPLPAWAQDDVSKCEDAHSDCNDSCSLKYGMVTKDSERLKLSKCLDKCKRADQTCRDQHFEAKQSGVDPLAEKKADEKKTEDPAPAQKKQKDDVKSAETQPKPSTQPARDEPKKKKDKDKDRPIDEWDPSAQ